AHFSLAPELGRVEVRLQMGVVVERDGYAARHRPAALGMLPPRPAGWVQPAFSDRITRSLVTGFMPGSGLTSTKLATPSRSQRTSTRATSRNAKAFQIANATAAARGSSTSRYSTLL